MIKNIDFRKKNFQSFVKEIQMPFEKNNNLLSKKPWIYRKKKNFFYKCFIADKKILGTMVYSKHKYNYHLNFIYIIPERRSKKIGNKLLNYYLSLEDRKYFTTHVNKKSKKTIKFYKKNLFSRYFMKMKIKELDFFKKESIDFNSYVYKKKILFFKKAKNFNKNKMLD